MNSSPHIPNKTKSWQLFHFRKRINFVFWNKQIRLHFRLLTSECSICSVDHHAHPGTFPSPNLWKNISTFQSSQPLLLNPQTNHINPLKSALVCHRVWWVGCVGKPVFLNQDWCIITKYTADIRILVRCPVDLWSKWDCYVNNGSTAANTGTQCSCDFSKIESHTYILEYFLPVPTLRWLQERENTCYILSVNFLPVSALKNLPKRGKINLTKLFHCCFAIPNNPTLHKEEK